MSQTNPNLIDKETKSKFERKKRTYEELEPFSDEESLIDDDNIVKGTKDRLNSKKSKNKNVHNNLQSLRELRLIKKIINKENQGTVLSQEQLDYAKKIVEENVSKESSESLTNKLKTEVEKNKEKDKLLNTENSVKNNTNNVKFEKSSNICIESAQNLNFEIFNSKNENEEILHYLGLLNSCRIKIAQNNISYISLEVIMEKNENEMLKFLINFNKKSEEKDYVEYIPILTTFKLEGDDVMFYEELDIHKEDLGKMIKRLLNYKYK